MVEKRGPWACKSIGYIVFWPAKWLQDKNEEKYLKVQGSAGWLSRLVCNCSSRSTSIANGTKLGELKKKRNQKLEPSDDQPVAEKKMKGEQVVTIKVGNSEVKIFCPAKRAHSADLMVLLHADHLGPVFKSLEADCKGQDAKRTYQKTGKFAKGSGTVKKC